MRLQAQIDKLEADLEATHYDIRDSEDAERVKLQAKADRIMEQLQDLDYEFETD